MTEHSNNTIGPISLTNMRIKKSLLTEVKTLAGFDRGASLCKLLYRSKTASDENSEFYDFTCALFYRADFIASLDWMKAEAQLPQFGTFYVTGTDDLEICDIMNKSIGLDVVFVDVYASQSRGAYFLIINMEPDEILHDIPDIKAVQVGDKSPFYNLFERDKRKMNTIRESRTWPHVDRLNNLPMFPVMYSYLGSEGFNMCIESSGKTSIGDNLTNCGKTFLGMARCLLNTCDYSEIIKLAESGLKQNVDTVVGDILPEEYLKEQKFPADIAVFPLGKIVDNNMDNVSTTNSADLARSLISLAARCYILDVIPNCVAAGIPQVYIGGNFMQSVIFREEMEQYRGLWGQDTVHFKYLNTGHTGALGAMLHQPTPSEVENVLHV